MSQLTIHIGLHKTGTSFLQYILFPQLKGVEIYRGFNPVRRIMMLDPTKKILLSDEAFSGNPLKGNYFKEFEQNIKRLKLLFGDPKIIMGVRDQQSLIPSLYKQYLQELGSREFDFIFNIENTGKLNHDDLFIVPRIQLLKKNFSNVFIYNQKAFANKQEAFIKKLVEFMELEPQRLILDDKKNKGNISIRTVKQVEKLRKLNKINAGLKKVNSNLGLYGGLFKTLKITPRDIAQNRSKSTGTLYEPPKKVQNFISDYYSDDWNQALNLIDFK